MFGLWGRGAIASVLAIAGFVAITATPARAASCQIGDPCPFTQGLFTGNVSQNPTGALNYIIPAAVGGTFTTSPIAFQWGFSVPDNPTPQDAGSIQAFAQLWLGVTLTSLIDANDKSGTTSTLSSTGFSTSTTANVYAVHFGGGELVFLFQNAVALAMSNWTGAGLSNFRSYNVVCTENCSGQGNPPAVPLPAALPLFASGSAVIGFFAWRRRKRAA